MKIGYIGLGLMGRPTALHLLEAGHTLHIWARDKNKVQDLLARGMVWADSPAELAAGVDILFTNLTDTPDVEQVLLGENGVADGGKPGLVVVDMSTISAIATRTMAERLSGKGIVLVDAPVSGGTAGAQNATLTIMVGAEPEVFEKIEPVLSVLGSKVTRMGGTGSGQAAKSCNQIIVTVTLMAVSEAFELAKALGVDPAVVREALLGGFAQSRILELHGQRMINGDYEPGFKTGLHLKDMKIVAGLAQELELNLAASKTGIEALEEAMKAGYADLDSSVIYKILEKH